MAKDRVPVEVPYQQRTMDQYRDTVPAKKALIPYSKRGYVPSVEVREQVDGTISTAESFGIEAVIDGRQGMMSTIIPRGEKVPLSRTRRYYPVEDYQQLVRVTAFKGEHPVAQDNVKLGEFVVSGLVARTKDASRGIDITFTINTEGVILVDACEVEKPENHLKVKLEYRSEGLLKSVAKGFVKEVIGLLLPSGRK